MKIVADISKEDYAEIMYKKQFSKREMDWADRVIANATPLEKVLDDIKAEIRQVAKEEKSEDAKWARGLLYSLVIINKYISGKENNDANA